MAIITLCSALAHEAGHVGYIMLVRKVRPSIKGVLSGFRIRSDGRLSYNEEIGVYLSGPAVNILLFIIFTFLAILFGDLIFLIAIINLATALSNLLPIEGYDGYGAIISWMNGREYGDESIRRLEHISSSLIFLFSILSLYLIDRQGGGYWMFGIFFISMIKCIKRSMG